MVQLNQLIFLKSRALAAKPKKVKSQVTITVAGLQTAGQRRAAIGFLIYLPL